jgi:hypothetical protein
VKASCHVCCQFSIRSDTVLNTQKVVGVGAVRGLGFFWMDTDVLDDFIISIIFSSENYCEFSVFP